MDANDKLITLFSTRVRQLLLMYDKLKGEKKALEDAVAERDAALEDVRRELERLRGDYNSLKMAKMIEITDGDMESAQKRLSKLAMAEMDKDKLLIRLHVYDTEMAVNIPREDEALYRNSAILITDTVNSYASYYKGRKSDKELLYMAMIDIALRYERESKRNDTAPFSEMLKRLTSEIEETLDAESATDNH